MKNKLAVAGLAAGLVGGAAAGLALAVPNLANAQSTTTAPPAVSPTTTVPGATTTVPGATTKPDRSAKLAETLAPLVADGTITQAQADKVIAAIEAARPEGRGPGGGRGGHGIGTNLAVAAKAIGVTEAELRQALADGKTVSEVAKDKGVDVQKVIDALVADVKTRLDAEVAAGKLTQAQADERLAAATERITALVDTKLPAWPGRPGRGGDGAKPPATPPTTTS